jgi:hypothetical protein
MQEVLVQLSTLVVQEALPLQHPLVQQEQPLMLVVQAPLFPLVQRVLLLMQVVLELLPIQLTPM